MTNSVNPEAAGFSGERLDRLRTWLNEQVTGGRLAGAGVLVARQGRTAFFETTGHADKEAGLTFEKDTIVRIYSMTKPVTTVAAMMLYEQGCFQLDDAIAAYLPEFADMRVWSGGAGDITHAVPADGPITVKQLMTHTSGLTYSFMSSNPVDAAYRERGLEFPGTEGSLAEWVEKLAAVPLVCQPGSAWNYSVSIDVLGRLVEVWSGQSLEQFFHANIFAPLGMTDTGFHADPAEQDRFATLYGPAGGGDLSSVASSTSTPGTKKAPAGVSVLAARLERRFLRPATVFSGGGGLVGTMGDYARFCQMLLNGGTLDGKRLLARTTVDYMRRNHLPGNRDMAAMGQPVWSETSYNGIGFGLGYA
ncbi:MAG: serine hydrolase domain-containing protein, partial [Hyphomicrobiaceae bacterium]